MRDELDLAFRCTCLNPDVLLHPDPRRQPLAAHLDPLTNRPCDQRVAVMILANTKEARWGCGRA